MSILSDKDGVLIGAANPLPVSLVSLPTLSVAPLAAATASHTRATITTLADTVLPAVAAAKFRSVQVVGTSGSVLVFCGASTAGGTLGDILDPAPLANRGGGAWDTDRYTGAIALRALGGDVDVSILEY